MATTYKFKDAQKLNAPAPSWKYLVSFPYLVNTNPVALNNNYCSNALNPGSLSDIVNTASTIVGSVQNFVPSKPIDAHILGLELPQVEIGATARYYSGRSIYFPSRVSVQEFNVTLYEDEKYTVTKYLQTWLHNVCNTEGNYGVPEGLLGYKKRLIVSAFDTVGKETGTWEIRGVYSLKPAGYDYGGDKNEGIRVTCTFSCDWVEFLGNSGSKYSDVIRKFPF